MTLFLCKMLLLLLGITSLVATLPEIKEGLMTFLILIQQLQNIHKHRPFHHGHRACMDQHKSNSTLNEVRMEWGRELHLGNVSFLAEMVWAKGQSGRGTTNDGRC